MRSKREIGPRRHSEQTRLRVKYWEIIADNLKKTGWSLGLVSAVDSKGRTIWIADAHRDGKRFVVRGDEKLAAFLELEGAICASGELPRQAGKIFPRLAGYENKHSSRSNHIRTHLLCAFTEGARRRPATPGGLSQLHHCCGGPRPSGSHP